VFEGLALAEFGNRIPQLTFEVETDAASATHCPPLISANVASTARTLPPLAAKPATDSPASHAVFEGLALAEFGNRIPQLTFEVETDAAPVTCGMIAGALSATGWSSLPV
jgi:hypothetical protein